MYYALIRTDENNDTVIGRVLSAHHTREAAERANARLQRQTRNSPYNPSNGYVPTIIAETGTMLRPGTYLTHEHLS